MRQALKLHPDSRCTAVTHIEVEIARAPPGVLVLRYFVTGAIGDLRMPVATASTRGDGLWQHTCFEAFARTSPDAGYYEFNFAPSTQWAAYRFSGYRSGMRVATEIGPPPIEARSTGECFELQTSLDLDRLQRDAAWELGLSAVIEEANGRKSYWAVAHPPGDPDFHHSDCFALELPAAKRS